MLQFVLCAFEQNFCFKQLHQQYCIEIYMKQSNSHARHQVSLKQKRAGLNSVRQSQPLLGFQILIDGVARIKKQHELRKNKLTNLKKNNVTSNEPMLDQIGYDSKHSSSKLLNYDTSFELPFKKQTINKNTQQSSLQIGYLKNDEKVSKASLQKLGQSKNLSSREELEKLLSRQKKFIPKGKNNRTVIPRFSQVLLHDYSSQQAQSLQNKFKQKFSNMMKNNEQSQIKQNLKETISTISSYKSVKQIKIDDFQLGMDLGKGKFGKVKMVRHKKTGLIFSLKIIKKQVIKEQEFIEQLIKQIKIQSFSTHTHIIKLFSVFDDEENIYLLLQFCHGGNLYQYLQKNGKMPQSEASTILKSICSAVEQLHEHFIVHRDIKPENIVLCYGMAKICDFGWSTCIKNSMRQTICGTPLYISPQLLKGQLYDEKVDLWAIGVLGFQMLTGKIPFNIRSVNDLAQIVQNKIEYPEFLSPLAIDFLQKLLEKNPQNRVSLSQMMKHPFLTNF